jgi:hypothetical protein
VYNSDKEEYSMVDVELAQKHNYPMPSKIRAALHIYANKIYGVLGLGKIIKILKKI